MPHFVHNTEHEVGTAAKLRPFAAEVITEPIKALQLSRKDIILTSLSLRCLETHDALYAAAQKPPGAIDDAFALLRTLIENVINIGYLALADASELDRYEAHGEYREWVELERFMEDFPIASTAYTQEELRLLKERAEKHALAFQFNKSSQDWATRNIYKRAAFLDEKFQTDEFRWLMSAWRGAANAVHVSFVMLRNRLKNVDGRLMYVDPVTPERVASLLFSCNRTLFALAFIHVCCHHEYLERYKAIQGEWAKLNVE